MDFGVSALNNVNLDVSSSSSDAADVLIRSTKVVLEQKREKAQAKLSHNNNSSVSVRKQSDSADKSYLDETSQSGCVEQMISPVLPANMPSPLPGELEERKHYTNQVLGAASKSIVPAEYHKQSKISTVQTGDRNENGQDVLISRYCTDGRGAVLAALKQRSHSAPPTRKVKVKLLDAAGGLSAELQGPEASHLPSGDAEAATSAAAITAAAIAATAPLIKAQSEMEARVAQVASELQRLQKADGRADRPPEGRAGIDRIAQLEEQLTILTQQRLQHLERIQGQQLELQNCLLGSALNAVTTRNNPPVNSSQHTGSSVTLRESALKPGFSTLPIVDSTSAGCNFLVVQDQSRELQTGGEKSPLETPAPRKVIPRPTRWRPAAQSSQHSSSKTHTTGQKKYGNGRPVEQIPNNQTSPTRCPAQSVGVKEVAIETVNDSQPEQSRENPSEASVFPAGRGEAQDLADPLSRPQRKEESRGASKDVTSAGDVTVQQANAMLQDLSRLKNEMRSLFQTADAFPVKSGEASRSSRSGHPAPPTLHSPSPPPLPPPISMNSDLGNVVASRAVPLSLPSALQKSRPPSSMFEDAGQVLRHVRHSRKVLEENLQAIMRAKDGEVLHTQLEALANNRDATEVLRIKKTVDAWINTLNKEIQDELKQQGSAVEMKSTEKDDGAGSSVQREHSDRSRSAARDRPGKPRRDGKGAAAAAWRKPTQRDSIRAKTVSTQPSSQHPDSSVRGAGDHPHASVLLRPEDDESYLKKVYGKALYEGHRRTLKKAPYLRLSSPTPKSKAQRPKVIESVKGVKVKSSKTQTSLSEPPPSVPQPPVSEPLYLFSPTGPDQQQQPGSPLHGYLIPMAIPLGRPRVDARAPLPSRVIVSDKPAIVTTSFPPAPAPAGPPPVRKPNTVLLEVRSEPRRPAPQLQIQVQPSVNIESVIAPSPAPSSPPPLLPPSIVQTHRLGDDDEDEDEDDGFPGTAFLASADISQDHEAEAETPDAVVLNGLASPPAALYHGPAFPAQPPRTHPLTEPVLSTIQHRETLENRLVEWVEQQLMARVVSGLFPPPEQVDPTNQSEPENSITSDIVEAAGGGGLQLFVDAGVPVDSQLIRQYVNEVLAEIITLTLGQREGSREPVAPGPTKDTHAQREMTVPTPVATPEPSENGGAPALQEAPSLVNTPDISEQNSPAQSPRDVQSGLPPDSALPESQKTPVVTPTSTPVPSPVRVETPSPPPKSADLRNHPWGDTELPLREEVPYSEEEDQQPPPVALSVAPEEKQEETDLPLSSVVLIRPPSSPAAAGEELPLLRPDTSSVEESSSRLSSSLTETETETADKHSEGEVFFSCGQMAAVRVLKEEGFTLPNMMLSFNSSLHGVQDMDYDPPSEGQVIRRPLFQAHHDPILSLLARMEQGPISQLQQPERSWEEESSGEISEGQRPVLTTAQEKVMTGHSLVPLQQQTSQNTAVQSPHTTLTSPGEQMQPAGGRGAVAEDSRLSEGHAETPQVLHHFTSSPTLPEESTQQQTDESPQTVRRAAPILVKQYHSKEEPGTKGPTVAHTHTGSHGADVPPHAGGDMRPVSVRLPSVPKDNQSSSISTIEGDSDSASDVF